MRVEVAYGCWKIFWHLERCSTIPLATFFMLFLFFQGFRDGVPGTYRWGGSGRLSVFKLGVATVC